MPKQSKIARELEKDSKNDGETYSTWIRSTPISPGVLRGSNSWLGKQKWSGEVHLGRMVWNEEQNTAELLENIYQVFFLVGILYRSYSWWCLAIFRRIFNAFLRNSERFQNP